MFRGTTPTNKFTSTIDLSSADAIYITYQQANETVLEKTIEDITFGEGFVSVQLTQEETLLFSPDRKVTIQIRAKFPDGSAIASNAIVTSVEAILKEGVI